jgi:hypothetical protein
MPMTERHSEPSASGRPMNTGEFRAMPDASASTAQFQAFAESEAQPARQWELGAPGRRPGRMTALVLGGIVVLAIIIVLIATLG